MKILLVEDDVNLREVIQRSLEKERYIVEVAPDFRTGIQKNRGLYLRLHFAGYNVA